MAGNAISKTVKIWIIVLAGLLAASLLALGAVLIRNYILSNRQSTVTVPDNIITPEGDDSSEDADDEGNGGQGNESAQEETTDADGANTAETTAEPEPVYGDALELHNRLPEDNKPFHAVNMFPGDKETNYYCVRVYHKGDVTLRFRAEIRPEYEKLAEVMKCRVMLSEKGIMLYDGLMKDMPKSVNSELYADSSTTSEVYYEITAYLDTGVGNDYMNKDLVADFDWWVEETENLDPPQTGDTFAIYLIAFIASAALFALIVLWRKSRKEENDAG